MNRGFGLVLALLVIAAALFAGWYGSVRKIYFDPKLYQDAFPCSLAQAGSIPSEPLDPMIEDWLSEPLKAAGEPSLYLEKPPGNTTTLRFTFLPAFTDDVIVRIDDVHGPAPRLTATRVVGQVAIREGPDRIVRTLSPAEAESIRQMLASSRVLDLPPDSCISGIDGAIYLIEANGPDGYRFINRWLPSDGPVYDLATRMYRLTGWPNGLQGPDRSDEALDAAHAQRGVRTAASQ